VRNIHIENLQPFLGKPAVICTSSFPCANKGFANTASIALVKELTLRELLDDPLVQDVMRSDNVSRLDVVRAYYFEAA